MSGINVMGMTSAIFLAAVATVFWLVGKMNDAGLVVHTGVVQGMPIPIKTRWLWLNQVVLVFAFIAITGSVANLLTGISALLAYVSALREAEAEAD